MSSAVLNAKSGNDQVYATGVIAGSKGVVAKGSVEATGSFAYVGAVGDKNTTPQVAVQAVGDGASGACAAINLSETSGALSQVQYSWLLGTGGGGGAIPEGVLALDAYINGGFSQGLLQIAPCPRGAAGPPVIPPNAAIVGFSSPFQRGVAQVAAGGTTIAVPQTSITANSIVMATLLGNDATAKSAYVEALTAGVGFTLAVSPAATAAVDVAWFIVAL